MVKFLTTNYSLHKMSLIKIYQISGQIILISAINLSKINSHRALQLKKTWMISFSIKCKIGIIFKTQSIMISKIISLRPFQMILIKKHASNKI
jgi:hypothetical protein